MTLSTRTSLVLSFLLPAVFGSGCACGGGSMGNDGADDVGDDDTADCSDEDGDQYGVGSTCLGSDCDDSNVEVWDAADCAALCEDDPQATGCPCDADVNPEPTVCYGGAAGTQGVGPCVSGLRTCDGEVWSPCDGQVVPQEEACNEADDDCDGEIDDGLPIGPCGTCSEDCQEDCVGAAEGCDGFDVENEGTNVESCEGLPPEECVTLGGDTQLDHTLLWIASARGGTISKIDTRERVELARYWTGPLGESGGYLSGPGDGPSRTSVDRTGDVVVANRAFGGQSSVTRVAADGCPDENGDGEVRTSSGGADVLPWSEDECVLWNTPVGAANAIARGLAVQDRTGLDGVIEERVWAGLFNESKYVELDRADGAPTGEEADCSPCTPYGAAVDRDGNLWSACLTQNVCRFDTEDVADVEVITEPVGATNYGMTVDEDGRVWLCGGTCQIYDPADDSWTALDGWSGFGVASDGRGSVWIGSCFQDAGDFIGWGNGYVCRVDYDTLAVEMTDAHSRGVAVDTDGFVWGVPMNGYLDVLDPADETVERALNDCGAGGAAGPCLTEPYTYSDMTGFQLQNATDPLGTYSHVFEGCDVDNTWDDVTWEATVPAGAALVIEVRSVDDLAALPAAPWIELGNVADLESPASLAAALGDGPHGRYLEVRFRLMSLDGEARPRLTGMGAQFHCGGGVG